MRDRRRAQRPRLAAASIVLCMLGLSLCFASCKESSPTQRESAAFGIFFGGQVQKRREIPFELNSAKQRHGFRIELTTPAQEDRVVQWELSMPDRSSGRSGARRVGLAKDSIAAGESRFDHVFTFSPGDPLGLWNIRILLGGRVLLDRPFLVFDARKRRAALKKHNKTNRK
ncbi:MAG: hypothetical protein HRU17_05930 [Polyangiaceae bacterium]|nr:hypothetical protein [Polyangiaceae bacterium]